MLSVINNHLKKIIALPTSLLVFGALSAGTLLVSNTTQAQTSPQYSNYEAGNSGTAISWNVGQMNGSYNSGYLFKIDPTTSFSASQLNLVGYIGGVNNTDEELTGNLTINISEYDGGVIGTQLATATIALENQPPNNGGTVCLNNTPTSMYECSWVIQFDNTVNFNSGSSYIATYQFGTIVGNSDMHPGYVNSITLFFQGINAPPTTDVKIGKPSGGSHSIFDNEDSLYTAFYEGTSSGGGGNQLSYETLQRNGIANIDPSDPYGNSPISLGTYNHSFDYFVTQGEDLENLYLQAVIDDNNYIDIAVEPSDYYNEEFDDLVEGIQTTIEFDNTYTEVGIKSFEVRLKRSRWWWIDQTIASKRTTFTVQENSEADDYFQGAGGNRSEYPRGTIPQNPDLATCATPDGVVDEFICGITEEVIGVMKWAFVPTPATFQKFATLDDQLLDQFPFSYLSDMANLFTVSAPAEDTVFDVVIPADAIAATGFDTDLPIFKLEQENEFLPQDVLSTLRFLMGVAVWLTVVYWLWDRTRKFRPWK
jgi:hypothetical protein